MIVIRGLGGVVTGRVDQPRREVSQLLLRDGAIGDGSEPTDSAEVIDAAGRWAVPGTWDGAATIYFGDHEPTYSARGSLAGAVAHGTTTLVAGGPVPIPGWVGTPRSQRELAVLAMKSWKHDRPRGIKVVAGVVDADSAWDAPDLIDLQATGASTLVLSAAFPIERLRELASAARNAGLRVGLRVDACAHDASTVAAAVGASDPNVVLLAGAGSAPIARQVLADTKDTSVGIRLSDDIGEAATVVNAAADTDDLHRVFLGTGLPGSAGVLPGGMSLFMDFLVRATSIDRDRLFAAASGNVARAFGLPGGVLEVGAPADVVLVDSAPDESGPGSAWTSSAAMTFIDGAVAWTAEGVG